MFPEFDSIASGPFNLGYRRGKNRRGFTTLWDLGAPGGNRTHDNLLRRQMLYPTELQAQPDQFHASGSVPVAADNWHTGFGDREAAKTAGTITRRPLENYWRKPPGSKPTRCVPSDSYYARLRGQGKLICRRRNRDLIRIAKLHLANLRSMNDNWQKPKDSSQRGRIMGSAAPATKPPLRLAPDQHATRQNRARRFDLSQRSAATYSGQSRATSAQNCEEWFMCRRWASSCKMT